MRRLSDRGRTICTNNCDVPMLLADEQLVSALLEDVLDETIATKSIDEARRLLQEHSPTDQIPMIERELHWRDCSSER